MPGVYMYLHLHMLIKRIKKFCKKGKKKLKYILYSNLQCVIMIRRRMYIYHALINALSAHMIHINLNMIFYTHVEHSPTKEIFIKYYTKQQKQTKSALQTHTHARTHARTHAHTHHTHTHHTRTHPPPQHTRTK